MTDAAASPADLADRLNHDYERLHTAKEDAFWSAYMGLADDADRAREELSRREIELSRFLNAPDHLAEARRALELARQESADAETRTALGGWVKTFEAHAIDSAEGRARAEEIVALEAQLARARASMALGYEGPNGKLVPASSVKLATMIANEKQEPLRRAAWTGLKRIENHVLQNGFLEVVRKRNALGRLMGAEDYYDWKVRRVEGLSKAEIFDLLDDLEERTRDRARSSLESLAARKGAGALRPWNLRFWATGDVTAECDPYFSFSDSFSRWGRSFAALGIRYRGAELALDLIDRKGKYENGFMHGPVPAWREKGRFRPARIQFTANAIPGLVGSGKRATKTLFHEGGHAAHFANIDMPSPCFAQEFAPTSVAFAETQSMFLDSLLDDADWQTRYALDAKGKAMPPELVEKAVRTERTYAAWMLRASFAICYCERAIYEIPDSELTTARVLKAIRAEEKRLLFIDDASPRPALTVPHLLAGESSAYYHGYILALMAVHQTRRFFLKRDGHLMDNPHIGPSLRRFYWQPGNSRRFPELVKGLTGTEVSPAALAEHVNTDPERALATGREKVARLAEIPLFEGEVDLDATIRVVNGRELIATTKAGFAPAAKAFSDWIEEQAHHA